MRDINCRSYACKSVNIAQTAESCRQRNFHTRRFFCLRRIDTYIALAVQRQCAMQIYADIVSVLVADLYTAKAVSA